MSETICDFGHDEIDECDDCQGCRECGTCYCGEDDEFEDEDDTLDLFPASHL